MSVQHAALTGAQLHEDKLISTATTADAGKVTTPSSVTNGVGTLRKLTPTDISGVFSTFREVLFNVTALRRHYYRALRTYNLASNPTMYIVAGTAGIANNTTVSVYNTTTATALGTVTITPALVAGGQASFTLSGTLASGDIFYVEVNPTGNSDVFTTIEIPWA